jgi:hypothetical protein
VAKVTEKSLDKRLREQVKKLGGWSVKLQFTFVKGMPDRLLLFPGGRVAFAEVKTPGEKPSAAQRVIIKKLIKLGFDVYVVDSPEVINQIIREYEIN